MSRRRANKLRSRERRAERRWLTHASGCTEPHCATKWFNDPELLAEFMVDPERVAYSVSVPRSLRHILGRRLGDKR